MSGTYEWTDLSGNVEEHWCHAVGLTPEGGLIFKNEDMATTLIVAPGQWRKVERIGD